MKVLFVGEGPQDVGAPGFAPDVRAATGVIPTLARQACPPIGADSIAMFWREVPILPARKKRSKGFAAKVRSAVAVAVKNACAGTVCVVDRDGDQGRLTAMEEGAAEVRAAVANYRVVCGEAVESVEAWLLGTPSGIAAVLDLEVGEIQKHYRVAEVEQLYQNSEKQEKRPKDLLEKLAQLKNQTADTEFRERIANYAKVEELDKHCSRGFRPFVEKLRAAFGPRSQVEA